VQCGTFLADRGFSLSVCTVAGFVRRNQTLRLYLIQTKNQEPGILFWPFNCFRSHGFCMQKYFARTKSKWILVGNRIVATNFNQSIKSIKLRELWTKLSGTNLPQWLLWLNVAIFPMLLILFLVLEIAPKPPIVKFEQALKALSQARNAESRVYAGELLKAAELCWDKALKAWRKENQKFLLSRDYRVAQYLAESSTKLALESSSKSKTSKESSKQIASAQISILKRQVEEFKSQYYHLPVDNLLRKEFARGELKLKESEFAYIRKDYKQAVAKSKEAAFFIEKAGASVTESMNDYFDNLPKWQRWAKETIAWSAATDSVAIVVDKMAHVCQVYQGGKIIAQYSIELGPQWLGPKLQRGDKATPEGQYRIKKKKGAGQSKYYKALEIDYPNGADLAKFRLAKQNGDVPSSAQIGGLIEIHGDGGKGANWTSGCVALKNEEMDEMFDLASVGTPITIVGSLKALSNGNGNGSSLAKSDK